MNVIFEFITQTPKDHCDENNFLYQCIIFRKEEAVKTDVEFVSILGM